MAERIEVAWSVWRRVAEWIACCVILLGCPPGAARDGVSGDKGPFSLDLERRSIRVAIGPEVHDPQAKKFVEIEIAEVFNPAKIRLAFELHDQRANEDKVLLGTFALFPPYNPARFIVATGGRLRSGDVIVLSMQVLDEVGPRDEVRVKVKRIGFRER